MCKLSLIQLQALNYSLMRLHNTDRLQDYKIVIKCDSKLICGDFLLPLDQGDLVCETRFDHYYENSFKMKYPEPSFFSEVFDDLKYSICIDDKPIDYMNVLVDTLISKIKSIDTSKNERFPRPVIYNAVFLESGLRLPFVQLDQEAEYEFISVIDSKSLESLIHT